MVFRRVMTQNWLTLKPKPVAFEGTVALVALLLFTTFAYLADFGGAAAWMPASANLVFRDHQYWRLWTTLLAHADFGHVLANLFLFVPFSYFLLGHFGFGFFPFAGFFLGGLVNFVVLRTMPPDTLLIGASGWVHWMGAASLTLYLLIDKRDSLRRRIAKVAVITAVLFVPESYKQEVSYLSHLVGFLLGVPAAALIYFLRRKSIRSTDVYAFVADDPEDVGQPGDSGLTSESMASTLSPEEYMRAFAVKDRLGTLIGHRLISISPQECLSEYDVKPEHFNPNGNLHGGALYTAMDSAQGAFLHFALDPKFKYAATGTATIKYTAAVREGTIRLRTWLKETQNRKLFVSSVATDANGTVVAELEEIWIGILN